MITVDNIDVWGFDYAIRGMRNPMNSWDKIDSHYCDSHYYCTEVSEDNSTHKNCKQFKYCSHVMCIDYYVGKNDLGLMKRLYKAGTEHRKYLRQIFVSMDITAPLYWWKEMDTYKTGTVSNSCSTMHKIHENFFDVDDFSCEHLQEFWNSPDSEYREALKTTIRALNNAREKYIKTHDKKYWWYMIQLLPTSYNQKRTITMNYENVVTIIKQRTGHKLDEWNDFVEVLKDLPYIKEITNADSD